jgi:activator of HSP90 ATPase
MKVDEIRTPTQAMFRAAIALVIVGIPYSCAALGTNSEQPSTGAALKSITIHQEVDFTVSPQRVYETLLDTKQFSAFSRRPAEINREVGGAFSLFSGHIIGRNLELIPNKRIVQAWRVVDWPEGVYSIARFELKPQGSGTHLTFDHIGFPAGLRDHLAEGWEANYWTLLKKYFG